MTSYKLEPTPQPPAALLTMPSVDVDRPAGGAHPERPRTEQIAAPVTSITQVARDTELDQPSVTKALLIDASHSDGPHPQRVEISATSEITGLVSDVEFDGLSTMAQQNLVIKDSTAVAGHSQKLSRQRSPGRPKHTSSHKWRVVKPAEISGEARDVVKGKRKRDLQTDHDGGPEQVRGVSKKPRIDYASVNKSFEGGASELDLALASLDLRFGGLSLKPFRHYQAPADGTDHVQDAEELQLNYCNDVPDIPIPTHLDVLELQRRVAGAKRDHRRAQRRLYYATRKAKKALKATSAGPGKKDCPKVLDARREQLRYHNLWQDLRYQVPERRRQYGKWPVLSAAGLNVDVAEADDHAVGGAQTKELM
ncbi:hypothetical protein H1R20_g14114, partial [Candolleomyces eurysporus]